MSFKDLEWQEWIIAPDGKRQFKGVFSKPSGKQIVAPNLFNEIFPIDPVLPKNFDAGLIQGVRSQWSDL